MKLINYAKKIKNFVDKNKRIRINLIITALAISIIIVAIITNIDYENDIICFAIYASLITVFILDIFLFFITLKFYFFR